MEGVVLLNASTGRLEGWGSLDVGGSVELVIWRSVSSLETAPMWVSPTQQYVYNHEKKGSELYTNMRTRLLNCMYTNELYVHKTDKKLY
jgi:hypothetical protein